MSRSHTRSPIRFATYPWAQDDDDGCNRRARCRTVSKAKPGTGETVPGHQKEPMIDAIDDSIFIMFIGVSATPRVHFHKEIEDARYYRSPRDDGAFAWPARDIRRRLHPHTIPAATVVGYDDRRSGGS